MPQTHVLQRLHDSEINASIGSFYDGCFTAKLGDEMNGFIAEETLPTMVEAERWLQNEAIARFPDSVFAKDMAAHQSGV